MARGKHAARAGRRANEAAIAHIDRLTEKVIDAQTLARSNKAAAARLPAVEQELERLRDIIATGESPLQARINEIANEQRLEREQVKEEREQLRRYFAKFTAHADFVDAAIFTLDEFERLAQLLHVGPRDLVADGFGVPRSFRDGRTTPITGRERRLKRDSRGRLLYRQPPEKATPGPGELG